MAAITRWSTGSAVCSAVLRSPPLPSEPLLLNLSSHSAPLINYEITFTRSRPYKKNDSTHVEQKNGAVVRRLTGHGRYSSSSAFKQLKEVYSLGRLHVNLFQPVRRLTARSREGARVVRYHDEATTPYQRMLQSGALTGARKAVLEKLYLSLNPLRLSWQIEAETEELLHLAWRRGDPLSWSPSR